MISVVGFYQNKLLGEIQLFTIFAILKYLHQNPEKLHYFKPYICR